MENSQDQCANRIATMEPPVYWIYGEGLVRNAFVDTQASITFQVSSSTLWLKCSCSDTIEPPTTTTTLGESEKFPLPVTEFPLNFRYLFSADTRALETRLREIIPAEAFPESFWERFVQAVSNHLRELGEMAVVTKPLEIGCYVQVDVQSKEEVDEENFCEHINRRRGGSHIIWNGLLDLDKGEVMHPCQRFGYLDFLHDIELSLGSM